MMNSNMITRFGRAIAILFMSFFMLMAVHACSKSENPQSTAKPKTTVEEKAGNAINQVTEKTKAITSDAVKTAGEVVDKATDSAKQAYDAAGSAVEKTTEKAKEAYQSADRMVSDTVKGDNTMPSSSTEMKSPLQVPSEQNSDTVETRVNKALESVPSIPGN